MRGFTSHTYKVSVFVKKKGIAWPMKLNLKIRICCYLAFIKRLNFLSLTFFMKKELDY